MSNEFVLPEWAVPAMQVAVEQRTRWQQANCSIFSDADQAITAAQLKVTNADKTDVVNRAASVSGSSAREFAIRSINDDLRDGDTVAFFNNLLTGSNPLDLAHTDRRDFLYKAVTWRSNAARMLLDTGAISQIDIEGLKDSLQDLIAPARILVEQRALGIVSSSQLPRLKIERILDPNYLRHLRDTAEGASAQAKAATAERPAKALSTVLTAAYTTLGDWVQPLARITSGAAVQQQDDARICVAITMVDQVHMGDRFAELDAGVALNLLDQVGRQAVDSICADIDVRDVLLDVYQQVPAMLSVPAGSDLDICQQIFAASSTVGSI